MLNKRRGASCYPLTPHPIWESSSSPSVVWCVLYALFIDDASCAPASHPVSVLAMHGDADEIIRFGGAFLGPYPGAVETIERFATHTGCNTGNPVLAPNLDVDAGNTGAGTTVLEYSGCPEGVDVTLWTLEGTPHIPAPWVPSALDSTVKWMIEHPRQ